MPRVTSRDNPRLVEVARLLASSRDRRKHGRSVLEGPHTIAVYLERAGVPATLVVPEGRAASPEIERIVAAVPPGDVLHVPDALFASLAPTSADVGLLAVVAIEAGSVPVPASTHVLLDGLQDPGNVGTILRTAAAAGVEQVLLSPGCAFAWAPKVLRAAQGAHFMTRVVEDVDLAAWAASFRASGGNVVATVPTGGEDLYAPASALASALARPWAVAIGNEGAGLSPAVAAAATARVTIPMPGGMESLNAGAAAAVVLFELVRRRLAAPE